MVKNASADYYAVGSFIDVVTTAHVITAALKAFGMSNTDDPCSKIPKFNGLADKDSKKT